MPIPIIDTCNRPALNTPSTLAVRAVKQAVVGASGSGRRMEGARISMERDAFASVWAGDDNQRAVQAVLGASNKRGGERETPSK